MRNMVVVRSGHDPITEPALKYLTSLGVPADLIKRIEVDSEVGQAQLVTVTLMVDADWKGPSS